MSALAAKRILEDAIHGGDAFEGYVPPGGMEPDVGGFFENAFVLDEIIDRLDVTFAIEVGSWKGASAIHMAERMKQRHEDFAVVCVDTWLGSVEHRVEPEWRRELNLENGFPGLYAQFLFNVHARGLAAHVLPVPLPSDQAAALLDRFELRVPLVFIDAAHDETSVYRDVTAYWPLLAPEGVLVCDDFSPRWPGVAAAVERFCAEREAELAAPLKWAGDKCYVQRRTAA